MAPAIPSDDGRPAGAAFNAELARLAFLEGTGEALSYLLDREEVLRELASRVVPELADYCVTYLFNPSTLRIRRVGVAHANLEREALVQRFTQISPPTLQDSFGAGAVIRTGEPMLVREISPGVIDDLPADHGYREVVRNLNPISSIVLPLRARGQTVGAVTFATTHDSGLTYGDDDLAFATAIARRAAVALDNARLYGESRREIERRQNAEAALRARYEQLRIVYQMTQAVSTTEALDDIYAAALGALEEGVGADRASILLLDAEGVMRFRAQSRLSESYRSRVEGHSPWTADTPDPEPIVVADVADDPGLDEALRATILAEGIRALAFVPLVFGRSLLGKFMLYFDRPHEPGREEIELAQTIARTIAFAIRRLTDEQSVRTAKEAAERASQAKSQFLGVMSHELRTPLNSVLGYAELLQLETKGPLTEGQQEYVQRIRNSANHQLGLIEELLTYTRLEAGRGDVRWMRSDVRRIVGDVLEFVRPEAEGKGIRLLHEVPDSALQTVTDPARVRQIVLNLVGNAVKFTDVGEIVVRAFLGDGHVVLDVRDTGPGIHERDLERIFDPFAQVDEGRTRRRGGTGLGLSIARRLTELLEGRLTVESRLGEGSTFTLLLPHRAEAPEARA